ncbi:response regulator receiver modulated diguanylate cyclase [Thalassoporum mexicanum PCC 7367]|uniref:diguanylate cyclase n=1 Tax=Thalassoporum mexicanum TaxID=3457544 RepID=UPI00029FA0D0|nr:diguanylate cyclase [Pseudanabaena sp. PCC 7367]AFY69861.1 response regulator receiver modulated diguanylate cyclase [Pseudanabaena sp. PCC 7367]
MPNHEDFNLLIVDDNEMNRDVLRRHLVRQGYQQILAAENGKEALEMLSGHNFDLILLDIQMPQMNGYELLAYLKADLKLSHIPVIMISAVDEIDSVVRCIEMGAEDYLHKPFNRVLLKARTSACLEKKRLRDQEEIYRQQLEEANKKLAEVNQQLEQLSKLDGLTGIANRRYFDDAIAKAWSIAVAEKQTIALIIFDIDFFKQFNDAYGHQAGDECLKQVARVAQRTIKRPHDVVARYGGEEFVVILPNTPLSGAEKLARELRQDVENLQINHAYSAASMYVTISLGVTAVLAGGDRGYSEIIANADKALFLAKQQGKNQVQVWHDGLSAGLIT